MPVFLGQLGVMLGGVAVNMLGQLVTERFIKHMIVKGLEVVVSKTDTKADDEILQSAKDSWGVK